MKSIQRKFTGKSVLYSLWMYSLCVSLNSAGMDVFVFLSGIILGENGSPGAHVPTYFSHNAQDQPDQMG